jgi:hypothetical protein
MDSEEALPLENERFSFALRKGQIVRLIAALAAVLGIIFYLALPQVLIAYQHYSNTTTAGVRDYSFPSELISGLLNLTGNGYFSYYKKSAQGPEVLIAQHGAFNGFALALLFLAVAAIALTLWLNFTRKNEKWSKITTLLYVICGLMCFMGPIFFLVCNGFGAADTTKSSNVADYWLYDSLYVHDAYGAIVTGLIFFVGAISFGVGTNLEGGDRNDIRNQE